MNALYFFVDKTNKKFSLLFNMKVRSVVTKIFLKSYQRKKKNEKTHTSRALTSFLS